MYSIWVGLRGAEAALAAADAHRRGDRLLRPDRAGRRLRSRSMRTTARRDGSTGSERRQDVDHERHDRRRRHRLGPHRGGDIQGFLVEKGTPGFSAPRSTEARCASVTSELVLQDVRVPVENVFPDVRTLRGPLSCLNEARYGIVWGAVGASRACFEAALSTRRSGSSSTSRSRAAVDAAEARGDGARAQPRPPRRAPHRPDEG